VQPFEVSVNRSIDQVIRGLAELHQEFTEFQRKAMYGDGHNHRLAIQCNELDTLYGLMCANRSSTDGMIERIRQGELLRFYSNRGAVWDMRVGASAIFVQPLDEMPAGGELFYGKFCDMIRQWAEQSKASNIERHKAGRKPQPEYDKAFNGLYITREYGDMKEAFTKSGAADLRVGFESFTKAVERRRKGTK